MMMEIKNPASGEVIEQIPCDDRTSLLAKFEKLQNSGKVSWSGRTMQERLIIIQKFLSSMREEQEKLAHTLTMEMGKPLSEARNEIRGACERVEFFLEQTAETIAPKVIRNNHPMKEVLKFEPLGVVAYISAWNYPYLIAMNVLIPALLGGNTVFYKPSEYTSLTGLHMLRLLHQAGVPEEALAGAIGGPEVGNVLLDLPCNAFFFTGSYKTGKYIAEKVGPLMVPMGFELGGKDPLYVMDSVRDVKGVASAAVEGAFYNNGQSCCAVERIYVHEKVYDQFMEHFIAGARELKVGNPLEKGITQGPLARKVQVDFLWDQVEDAKEKGATVVVGGQRGGLDGYFPPTVLVNVDHSMKLMKEESFGPVIGIQKVGGDEEAARLMNDTQYGLTASVYSDDVPRAEKLLDRIDVGTGFINCCDRVSPYLPWSGRNHSGLGSTLSYLGILTFVRPKAYHVRSK